MLSEDALFLRFKSDGERVVCNSIPFTFLYSRESHVSLGLQYLDPSSADEARQIAEGTYL